MRKSRGVYYTPEPVVNFIVRAVDDILKTEFNLPQGLADTSKIEIKTEEPGHNKKIKKKIHKVQILDPATGTGTFLAEIVKQIYKKFENQKGIWSSYVENELLPRLNGFEILMAPYTMCHLKLEVLLKQTGYKPKDENKQQRLRVFLTNSLEEAHPYSGTLFASWLSKEATEANTVKKETPVMIVLGNPPYSISSTNRGKWILGLIKDYKKDLNERNIQPLSDDYIKFIRYGQHFINKNGEGILAYISNNSFIDGIIHRQMRKDLLETFDKIYIIDLHGNSKKKEVCPDGSKDENVFDIQQGVSINVFIKKKKNHAQVFHYDLYGKRNEKYEFLNNNNISSIDWNELENREPEFFFIPKDFEVANQYSKGILISELLQLYSSGIQSEFDEMAFSENLYQAGIKRDDISFLTIEDIVNKYNLKQSQKKKIEKAKFDLHNNEVNIFSIQYKAFNIKKMLYTGQTNGLMGRPRYSSVKHILKNNISLILMRSLIDAPEYNTVFISDKPIDKNFYGFQTYFFPLYLYPETDDLQKLKSSPTRRPNLNSEIVQIIADNLKLKFTPEKEEAKNTFAPIDILDYIYAVLHSPSYRERYKEFLKIDFPRVPYPENKKTFWKLVKLGEDLRQIHLLESPVVEKYITSYPVQGDNVVSKVKFEGEKKGKVWINDTQYFDKVPKVSWEFYIGGYQPAQKWLKDRKRRELSTEDVLHYQKIIVALSETDKIMKEIDKVGEF